jgi:hypothetical protein
MGFFSRKPKYTQQEIWRQVGTLAGDILECEANNDMMLVMSGVVHISTMISSFKKHIDVNVDRNSLMAEFVDATGVHDMVRLENIVRHVIRGIGSTDSVEQRGQIMLSFFKGQ